MKKILFCALACGLAMSQETDPCKSVVPTESDDCLSVRLDDSICCMRTDVDGDQKTLSCERKPAMFAGKQEFHEQRFQGKKTGAGYKCTIKAELCSDITASKANDCLKATVPNGLCCFDHKQGVCFTQPFHTKSEDYVCETKKYPLIPKKKEETEETEDGEKSFFDKLKDLFK